jgi:DtxR family Mn-dependent transcriptional regulator
MNSQIEENYLKAIYKLVEKKDGLAGNTAIAQILNINPASVSEMLKRLHDKGYIIYKKQKGASLTDIGKRLAVKIIRKHRLWEVFLVEKMNFAWDEVHEVAEQLEHIQSEKLISCLDKMLEYPKTCPHGDPIPDSKGNIIKEKTISLQEASLGKSYTVKSFNNTSVEFLHYLDKINLKVGSKLKVLEFEEFDNTRVLALGKEKISISKKVSEAIFVV